MSRKMAEFLPYREQRIVAFSRNQWLDFIARPGARSTDPEFNRPFVTPASENSLIDKIQGYEITKVWIDEAHEIEVVMAKSELTEDLIAELEKLAKEMTEGFQATKQKVALLAPEALSVLTAKGWAKKSHIGGEEFVPHQVYLGKRGALIGHFKPADAATYQRMEMPIEDALTRLSGFYEIAELCCVNGYHLRIIDIRSAVSERLEKEEMAKKADVYADIGFGTW